MRRLALSTSSPALSIALFDDDRLVGRTHDLIGRGHAEALVPALAALLDGGRADALLVDIGPGSFTGIRIGIAAARALGLAWGAPVHGVSAAALVAAPALAARPDLAAVTVLLDAGRGQAFVQNVGADYQMDVPRPLPGAAAARLDPAVCCGALAPAGAIHHGHPDVTNVMMLPATKRAQPPTAIYVRPTDAVLPL